MLHRAIRTTGQLYGTGFQNVGAVGDNVVAQTYRTTPVEIWGGGTWIAVSDGTYYSSCAIASNFTSYCW